MSFEARIDDSDHCGIVLNQDCARFGKLPAIEWRTQTAHDEFACALTGSART
jgi:hypothetical protein